MDIAPPQSIGVACWTVDDSRHLVILLAGDWWPFARGAQSERVTKSLMY